MSTPAPKTGIDKCASCGRLYPRVYVRLCTTCVANEHLRFNLVRDYLSENAGGSIGEISEATGLSRGEILRFQSEGRLINVGSGSAAADGCTCGGVGERCAHCRLALARKFEALNDGSALPVGRQVPEAPAAGGRVHYVRRHNREAG